MLRFPRVVGSMALLWGVRAFPEAALTGDDTWWLLGFLWLAAAGFLVTNRAVSLACAGLLGLIAVEFFLRLPISLTAMDLLAWFALIVAITEGRMRQRALLLRICVTTVYLFVGISKLNPSWLSGTGVRGILAQRGGLEFFLVLLEAQSVATLAATAVVAVELWLAIGLWFERTRRPTALLGVVTHIVFIVVAATNPWAVLHLAIFNLGLVAAYIAFWHPVAKLGDVLKGSLLKTALDPTQEDGQKLATEMAYAPDTTNGLTDGGA